MLTLKQLHTITQDNARLPAKYALRGPYLVQLKKLTSSDLIKVITGFRRVGKTFLLKLLYQYLVHGKKVPEHNILFLNFEDPRLSNYLTSEQLQNMYETFLTGANLKRKVYLFLDEVQNVDKWEKFVRYLYDTRKEQHQIFVTGSNSKLLSSEYASVLAGRVIPLKVYPFTFKEIVELIRPQNVSKYLNEYLTWGGLPEIWLQPEVSVRYLYIKNLLEKILYDDITIRYNVADPIILAKTLTYILNNVGNIVNFSKIVTTLKNSGFETTRQTLKKYTQYLNNAFLVNEITNFITTSTKHIIFGKLKKFFAIDNSFITAAALEAPSIKPKLLENLVFNFLDRISNLTQTFQVYFSYDSSSKIDNDLTLKSSSLAHPVVTPIGVTYSLDPHNPDTIKREIKALQKSISYFSQQKLRVSIPSELFELGIQASIVSPHNKSKQRKTQAILFVWEPLYKPLNLPDWLLVINVKDLLLTQNFI